MSWVWCVSYANGRARSGGWPPNSVTRKIERGCSVLPRRWRSRRLRSTTAAPLQTNPEGRMDNETGELPDGALAYREYEVTSEHGTGSIAFTLGENDVDTMPARFAKHAGAKAYGLVSILGFPEAPIHPVIWVQTDTHLGVTVADEDRDLSEVLKLI